MEGHGVSLSGLRACLGERIFSSCASMRNTIIMILVLHTTYNQLWRSKIDRLSMTTFIS